MPSLVGNVDEFLRAPPCRRRGPGRRCLAAPATPIATYRPTAMCFPAYSFPADGQCSAAEIHRYLARFPEMNGKVRSIRSAAICRVCSTCSHATSCTRCPGLAYMEGDMRGPSVLRIAKSRSRAPAFLPPTCISKRLAPSWSRSAASFNPRTRRKPRPAFWCSDSNGTNSAGLCARLCALAAGRCVAGQRLARAAAALRIMASPRW